MPTIDFGIDLGTTNSAIAMLRGQTTQVIKNNLSQDITPSAVSIRKIQKTGELTLYIGERAKNEYMHGREAVQEFKRDMGTNKKYIFAKADVERTPVELSAEILKALRGDVQRVTGEVIDAVVITVPAVFPQTANAATLCAAEQAGFKHALTIQEPVAAAMIYGYQKKITENQYWLVFDFGGGTFDAALLKASRGVFVTTNHKGDNFLGGANIDWDILEQIVIPQLTADYSLPGFKLGNKKYEHPLRMLKYAVEQAKITLSGQEKVHLQMVQIFLDEDDAEVDYSTISLSRADIEKIARPSIDKAVALCKELLAESKLKPDDLKKVILVGGPTQAPYFRDILREYFGDIIDFSHNPMTVVAEGAAIFASQRQVPTQVRGDAPRASDVVGIEWLKYDPVGTSVKPMVSGKLSSQDVKDFNDYRIDFVNKATGERSGATSCAADGAFIATLHAQEGERNFFDIELMDAQGIRKKTDPQNIHYTVSAPIPKPTVINSLGIALADNTVEVAFRKGDTLPQKKKHLRQGAGGVFRTTNVIREGDEKTGLRVAVVEGENRRADLNRAIGEIVIDGTMVKGELNPGTGVEIYLKMDEDRSLFLSVVIPDVEVRVMDRLLLLETNIIDPRELRKKYHEQLKRAKEAVNAMRSAGKGAKDEALTKLVDEVSGWQSSEGHREIESKLDAAMGKGEGWSAAVAQADQLIRHFMEKVYELEELAQLPQAIKEVEETLQQAEKTLMGFGAALPNEMRIRFQQMIEQAQDSLSLVKKKVNEGFAEARDTIFDELEKVKSDAIQILFIAGAPIFYSQLCDQEPNVRAENRNAYRSAMLSGRAAIERGDFQALIAVNQQMMALLRDPPPGIEIGDVQ